MEAAEEFEAAAVVSIKELSHSDPSAEMLLDDAYKLFLSKNRPLDAVRCRQMLVDRHLDNNSYGSAATSQDYIGTIYENRLHDPDKAAEAYQLAAKWFMSDQRIA